MNIPRIWKTLSKATADNAPMILTSLGVAGVVTTAVFTGKATFKASQIISETQAAMDLDEQSHPLTAQEKLKLVWPQYVPAAIVGATAITCIIGANRISGKRAAALASAYTVSQKYFEDYKDKVAKKLSEKQVKEINDEIAKERVEKNPPPPMVVVNAGQDAWVYDSYTDHWFKSSHMNIERAVIDTNLQIANEGSATLGDFYRFLGVSHAAIYEEVGWNHEKKLEVNIGSTKMDDNTLAYTLDFRTVPVRGY